jgi:O-antigen/teichoic acid export membrane protein
VVGATWLLTVQVVERLIGIVSVSVLARLLTPTDFGTVAVAGTVVAIVELMSAFGFDWALVRRRDLSAAYLNSAWTLRALLGLATFVALALLGPPAAAFYRLPALRMVLVTLGLASFLGSLENIGTVFFRRDFAFHKEFIMRVATKLCGFVVTLSVALVYRSYWALVTGIITLRLSATVASYLLHPFRPRPTLVHARELLGFSSWLLLGNIIDYCRDRFSSLYLGRVFGPHATGLFAVSGELAYTPISAIAAPINRVAFSKYTQDVRASRALTNSYLEIASMIWLIALPMCTGTMAVAPEIVRLLLGPQWQDATTVVKLLTLGTVFNVAIANTHYVYWALGHARVVAALSAMGAATVIPLMIICSHYLGYDGVAWAYAVTSAALTPVNFGTLRRYAGIRFRQLWARVWRVTLAAAAMWVVLSTMFAPAGRESASAAAALLLVKVPLGAAIYAGGVVLLWLACGRPEGPERRAWELLQQWWQRPLRQQTRL